MAAPRGLAVNQRNSISTDIVYRSYESGNLDIAQESKDEVSGAGATSPTATSTKQSHSAGGLHEIGLHDVLPPAKTTQDGQGCLRTRRGKAMLFTCLLVVVGVVVGLLVANGSSSSTKKGNTSEQNIIAVPTPTAPMATDPMPVPREANANTTADHSTDGNSSTTNHSTS
ncbi:hypothetical protein ACHHYP_20292, partial [Achlya hypogyna]